MRHILALSPPPGGFELVVVNNGSTDDTSDVIAELSRESPIRVREIVEPRRGMDFARNAGLRAARGRVLAFTDDDCFPQADWLERIHAHVATDPRRVVGGRVELHDPAALDITTRTSTVRETLDKPEQVFGFAHGCNIAFHRAVVERIGAFDQRLGPPCRVRGGGDADFLYRAAKAGVHVTYEPDVVVFHDHGRYSQDDLKRLSRGYAGSRGAVAMAHLLRGDLGLVKASWWELRACLKGWVRGRRPWWHVAEQGSVVMGALKFLALAPKRTKHLQPSYRSFGTRAAVGSATVSSGI